MTAAGAVKAASGGIGTSAFRFEAIGTRWEIETDAPLGRGLEERILERIGRFDAAYSRFRPDSLVSRVATGTPRGFNAAIQQIKEQATHGSCG